jgi:ribosome recycling factor
MLLLSCSANTKEERNRKMPGIDEMMEESQLLMDMAIDVMKKDFAAVRTGKASPALAEGIMVEYYGAQTRLKDIASITAPEPRLLVIQPWDQSAIKSIEKAILASSLGISPVSDGRVIRLPIPELSEERRKDMTKLVNRRAEEARVEVRNARRDANEAIKKAQKNSDITEDDMKLLTDQVQKMTDKAVETINKILSDKEAELMAV